MLVDEVMRTYKVRGSTRASLVSGTRPGVSLLFCFSLETLQGHQPNWAFSSLFWLSVQLVRINRTPWSVSSRFAHDGKARSRALVRNINRRCSLLRCVSDPNLAGRTYARQGAIRRKLPERVRPCMRLSYCAERGSTFVLSREATPCVELVSEAHKPPCTCLLSTKRPLHVRVAPGLAATGSVEKGRRDPAQARRGAATWTETRNVRLDVGPSCTQGVRAGWNNCETEWAFCSCR